MKLESKEQKMQANFIARLRTDGWVKLAPGWKAVPAEATPQQIAAGLDNIDAYISEEDQHELYRAMITAAPVMPDAEA